MRVSASQYDLVNSLAGQLGVTRAEVMSNALVLIKFLIDNNATAVKASCKEGSDKELMLPLLVGNWSK